MQKDTKIHLIMDSTKMLKIINQLHPLIARSVKNLNFTSVFRDIAGYYYHENFHSDLLAHYLQNQEAKKHLIQWINTLKKKWK